jgi:hypothetical protein
MHTIGHDESHPRASTVCAAGIGVVWRAGPDDPGSTVFAVYLSMRHPTALSMTARQRAIFQDLIRLQQLDAGGPHSLLPNVMDALLALARQPWWDAGTADIADEADPYQPPAQPSFARDREGEFPETIDSAAQFMALRLFRLFQRRASDSSMTWMQRCVFHNLTQAQIADSGPFALLPQVLESMLALALRPWWDRRMADIADEIAPEPGQPA